MSKIKIHFILVRCQSHGHTVSDILNSYDTPLIIQDQFTARSDTFEVRSCHTSKYSYPYIRTDIYRTVSFQEKFKYEIISTTHQKIYIMYSFLMDIFYFHRYTSLRLVFSTGI